MAPPLLELLDCPICYESLEAPLTVCKRNGHAVCKKCLSKISKCPTCQSPMANGGKNTLLDQILQVLYSDPEKYLCDTVHENIPRDLCGRGTQPSFTKESFTCSEVFNFRDNLECNTLLNVSDFHFHLERYHKNCIEYFKFDGGVDLTRLLEEGSHAGHLLLINRTKKNKYYFLLSYENDNENGVIEATLYSCNAPSLGDMSYVITTDEDCDAYPYCLCQNLRYEDLIINPTSYSLILYYYDEENLIVSLIISKL